MLFGMATSDWRADYVDFADEVGGPPAFHQIFWSLELPWPNAWAPNMLTELQDLGITAEVEITTNDISALNSGAKDAQLAAIADTIGDWLKGAPGRRILIAPLPESNLAGHPWSNGPAAYKAGYKRIRNALLATGVDDTQIRFLFSMNGLSSKPYDYADFYPSDDVVDIIGFARLNRNIDGDWRDYDEVFTRHIEEMQGLVGPYKPILIMQTGTVDDGSGGKDAWLTDMMTKLPNNDQVVGALYFNRNKDGTDFRILANGVLRAPVKQGMANWSSPSQVDWIFDGSMDAWVAWRIANLPARLWGDDRYATAVAVSQDAYPGGADVVYLAVGTNYPDAIAAGPAAASEDAPILLASRDTLPAATATELKRLSPSKVVVLGGTAAISDLVIDLVENALPGATVVRRAGANRYETAVEVSKAVFSPGVAKVFIVTGENFPDALSAAPTAVVSGSPLLLVRPDSVPAVVGQELGRLDPSKIVILGGGSVLSAAVETALGAYAPTERVSAPNRYALSAALSQATFAPGVGTVFIAVGDNFPDALAGGPAARVHPGPLLLVRGDSIPEEITAELDRLNPSRVVILGGPAVISVGVADDLAEYVE
jgi:putative cell wall-binding protein